MRMKNKSGKLRKRQIDTAHLIPCHNNTTPTPAKAFCVLLYAQALIILSLDGSKEHLRNATQYIE